MSNISTSCILTLGSTLLEDGAKYNKKVTFHFNQVFENLSDPKDPVARLAAMEPIYEELVNMPVADCTLRSVSSRMKAAKTQFSNLVSFCVVLVTCSDPMSRRMHITNWKI